MASDCSTCRHHRSELQPKVLDAAFDTVVAFADQDDRVYFCTSTQGPHAGQKVGTLAILCDAFEEPRQARVSELDRLLAQSAERAARASRDVGDR